MSVRESIQRATRAQAKSEQQAKHAAIDVAANAALAARKIGLIRQGIVAKHAAIDVAANAASGRIQELARKPL